MPKNIVAHGGGLVENTNDFLNCYVLSLTTAKIPKVLLLPTASGDLPQILNQYYQVWSRYPCEPDHLSFFHGSVPNLEKTILSQDLILVSGGNTKSMLGVWREWGLDKLLKIAYDRGIVLAGGSAGAVCWFEEFLTDSFGGRFTPIKGLGLLPYSCCPHFSSKDRREAYRTEIYNKNIKAGYGITDHSALHFQDDVFLKGITSIPNQSAQFIEPNVEVGKKNIVTNLPITLLSDENILNKIWEAPCFQSNTTLDNQENSPLEQENQTNV